MSLKVDTGADTCIITTTDLQLFPFLSILPCKNVLRGYGGSEIENIGAATLRVSFKDKSANVKFNIVEAPGSPSMLGCRQSQDLGIISTNLDEVSTIPPTWQQLRHNLSKSTILKEYHDCFHKLGCFPREKYHIQLLDEPVPVIHPYKRNLTKWLQMTWSLLCMNQPTGWTQLYAISKKPLKVIRR